MTIRTPVRRICLFYVLATAAALLALGISAATAGEPAAGKFEWKPLFDGKTLKGWKVPESFRSGGKEKVSVKDGAIQIGLADLMNGVTYAGDVPKVDYEVKLEGKRVEGSDFFCTTTFPVEGTFCSFVVGGWGGTVVGLSSVDGYDASENQTNKAHSFKQNQWYKIRIRVTKAKIETWIDDEKIVDLARKEHKISIRWECEPCRPLGVSTWCTAGAIRDVQIRCLKPEEVKEIAEAAEKSEN